MDAQEIRKWHSIFKRTDELFEIRILGDRNPWSAYFYDVEAAIAALQPFDQMNIYYSVNEVKQACASRSQFGVFQQVKGTATSKQDIEHRWFLPIDVDCERPSGVSSTNVEKEQAYRKASDVYYFLLQNGISQPVVCDSSSGYHLLIPIDMENTQEAETAIKTFLEILSLRFTDDHVKIDTVLFDANRILRLPGSFGRKGRSTDERPHREAKILSVPQMMQRMTLEQIQAFNERFSVKSEPTVRKYNAQGQQEPFNLRDFINRHGLKVSKEIPMAGGGTKFVLEECFWDSGHKAPDAAIFEMPNGAIAYKCFHQSCQHHDWHELRETLEPDAYQPKYPQPMQYQRLPQAILPQPTVILPETAEKGKKWFGLKDIKKININDIPHFKTGFTQLDHAIKGLFFCEVTILSGSNSSGKSSWLNTLILNAVQQGVKTALFSGELRPDVLKTWIQMVAAGKDMLGKSQYGDYWFVPNNIADRIDNWLDGKLFLYNNDYSTRWEQVFNDIKEVVTQGVRFIVVDNLMTLSLEVFDGDNNKKQKALISQLCEFAKKEQVHIMLVAHPRKVTTFMRKQDISGTSDLTNAVDKVFIFHRVNNDFKKLGGEFFGKAMISTYFNYGNVVEVAKDRMMGVQDFLCGLYYEMESRRFKNTNDERVIYGWRDDIAVQQTMFTEQASNDMPFASPNDEAAPV